MNISRMFLMGVSLGFFVSVSNVGSTTIETSLEGTWSSPVWGGTSGSQYQNVGETFTLQPGEDTVLELIRFYVDDYAENSPSHAQIKFRLYVHVWDTYYDFPDPNQELFRSDLLMTNGLSGWQTFSVPIGGLTLETGTKYGWFISSAGENEDYGAAYVGLDYGPQGGSAGDAYPFGRMRLGSGPLGLSATSTNSDMAFSMEFSVVPEPATMGLAAIGLAALICLAWRGCCVAGNGVLRPNGEIQMFRFTSIAAVMSIPVAASGSAIQFQIMDLGTTPYMTSAQARGVSSQGIAAGQVFTHPGSAFDPTYIHAAILNGGPIELLADAGSHKDDSACALDINDLGVVGGYYRSRYNTYQRPAIWEDRLFKMAHMLPGGDQGEVRGLSSEIDWKAVGYSSVPISTGTILNRAVMWDKSLGTPTNLGTLATSEHAASVAEDVNTAHQVVGASTTDGGSVHAFLWEAASGMIDLGVLTGGSSEAKAINEAGHVVGNTSANTAFYWSPEAGIVPIAGSYEAWGINNSDVTVGAGSGRAGISFAPSEPMVALSTLLTPGSSGWTLYNARTDHEWTRGGLVVGSVAVQDKSHTNGELSALGRRSCICPAGSFDNDSTRVRRRSR